MAGVAGGCFRVPGGDLGAALRVAAGIWSQAERERPRSPSSGAEKAHSHGERERAKKSPATVGGVGIINLLQDLLECGS